MQYKGIELKCTEQELQSYINSIQITSEIRDFSQPYNNIIVENQTGDENAKYYILSINGSDQVQPHVPSTQGYVAITEENAQTIIAQHKQQIIDDMIISKFRVTSQDIIDQLLIDNLNMQMQIDTLITSNL